MILFQMLYLYMGYLMLFTFRLGETYVKNGHAQGEM